MLEFFAPFVDILRVFYNLEFASFDLVILFLSFSQLIVFFSLFLFLNLFLFVLLELFSQVLHLLTALFLLLPCHSIATISEILLWLTICSYFPCSAAFVNTCSMFLFIGFEFLLLREGFVLHQSTMQFLL